MQLDVHGLLQKEQIQGVALHSQMNQQKREAQLNIFRSGKCPILLATDVAARGIHVKNVEYVINYDFPGSLEQVR
jgi:superfamily II DNA/RNA helicase